MRLSRKKKRLMRKMIRFAANAFTWAVFMVFILSILALDNESWVPTIALILSGGWLTLVAWVNDWMCSGIDESYNE